MAEKPSWKFHLSWCDEICSDRTFWRNERHADVQFLMAKIAFTFLKLKIIENREDNEWHKDSRGESWDGVPTIKTAHEYYKEHLAAV